MKERTRISFHVSKYSIRMYMRRRRMIKLIRRAFDRWYSCLNECERNDVAEALGYNL